MKRILTAAAALLFSVAMFAQSNDAPPPPANGGGNGQMKQGRPPMSPEQRAKRETDRMNSITPLGDAYQKVMDVNKKDAAQRESIMNGAKRSELTEDQKSQLKALNEKHRKNLEAAMGHDLYTKYREAEKAKREEMKNSGGGRPDGGE